MLDNLFHKILQTAATMFEKIALKRTRRHRLFGQRKNDNTRIQATQSSTQPLEIGIATDDNHFTLLVRRVARLRAHRVHGVRAQSIANLCWIRHTHRNRRILREFIPWNIG